ncbi:MAG TPA: DUF3995 domain-containing protein [Kofleriaceae bacterium]|nr:DUF3995 domain-containing protein [Kofleriaceae bacterium]
MITALGGSIALVLSGLALLHLYWAVRGASGTGGVIPEVGGEPVFAPGPLACIAVAALLAAAAALVSLRAGLWSIAWVPDWALAVSVWVVAAVFALRAVGDRKLVGFTKRVRGTRFARMDYALYSPLCVLLAAGCAVVALGR